MPRFPFVHENWIPWLRCLATTLAVLVVWFCPVTASASTIDTIISPQAVTVQKGEVVEQLVVLGNDADIHGTVSDTVIVVGGDIRLDSSARVGIVIDLGGTLVREPGSHVNAVYTLSFRQSILNSAAMGSAMVLSVWALRLAASAGLVVFPLFIGFLLAGRLSVPLQKVKDSARRQVAVGALVSLITVSLCVLTALTVVGLPVTAVLLILYTMLGFVGFTVVASWLGQLIQVAGARDYPSWLRTLLGATVVMAFCNVPLAGPFVFLFAWFTGIGAVTSWLWNVRRRR